VLPHRSSSSAACPIFLMMSAAPFVITVAVHVVMISSSASTSTFTFIVCTLVANLHVPTAISIDFLGSHFSQNNTTIITKHLNEDIL
jgi:hypothetical protein